MLGCDDDIDRLTVVGCDRCTTQEQFTALIHRLLGGNYFRLECFSVMMIKTGCARCTTHSLQGGNYRSVSVE